MDTQARHLFIEIEKKGEGYDATLSDDSIDRDGEFFSAELIKAWGSEGATLPFLADHMNSMSTLVGGWVDRTVVEEDGNFKLKMKPRFFSSAANPLAQQIKAQIDEAAAMGLRIGLSIGFIPMDGVSTARGYMHTKAELVEGSAVPVQSNRHAGIALSKSAKTFSWGGTAGFLKTSAEHKSGDGRMATLEEVSKENVELKAKVAELEAKIPTLTEEQKAAADKAKAEVETERKAFEEKEKKIAAELKEYKDKYEQAKKEAETIKGKIPAEMLGAAGLSKEPAKKTEKYNAAKDYMARKGYAVD